MWLTYVLTFKTAAEDCVCLAGNYGAPGGFWYDPWSQDDPIMVSLLHAHHLLPIANCSLPITHCPLPMIHCPLPTIHCPLPIIHCSLPIVPLSHCLVPAVTIIAATESPHFLADCLLQLHNATDAHSLVAHGQCCVLFSARQH